MKKRADVLLSLQDASLSREKAQKLIMEGRVYAGEVRISKASDMVDEETKLTVRGEENPFASRGGHKLEKAITAFNADVSGLVCMDIGAAAGGFTDVLLRHGAGHVYAVDVGYGQMDWALRNDPRVTVMERTNARGLTGESVPLGPTLTVMDVSFISIRLLLPVLAGIMGKNGRFLTLIKPQFEAGRGQVGKNGVVRESEIHRRVITEIRDFCPSFGWSMRDVTFSPIKGPKGNIEFLADIRPGDADVVSDETIRSVVEQAHKEL